MNWIELAQTKIKTLLGGGRRHGRSEVPGLVPPPSEKTGELAWAGDRFFSAVPMEQWNPDELVGRQGYRIFNKMLGDDQVRALFSLKQAIVASRSWHFRVTGGDRRHRECAEFFRLLLEKRLQGPFKQVLGNMMSSQAFGFSLVEKVYEPMRFKGRPLWGVRALKLRPAESFTFEMDAHGNLTGLFQQQGGDKVRLPPWRFVHHVNKPEVHSLFGESDLREVHRHWWAKDNMMFVVALVSLGLCVAAIRMLDRWIFPKVSFESSLNEGNLAVAVFLAALVLGIFLLMGRATAAPADRYDADFRKWARYHFGYTYPWQAFKAQGMTESNLDPKVCSQVGACGLMQFMPGTAAAMGLQDRFNARASIRRGIAYDRRLWRQFTEPRPAFDRLAFAFMAYNAGLGNVLKFQRRAQRNGADHRLFRAIRPYVWDEPGRYVERIERWCRRFGGRSCSTG